MKCLNTSTIKSRKNKATLPSRDNSFTHLCPLHSELTFSKSLLSFYYVPSTQLALLAVVLKLLLYGSGSEPLWVRPGHFTIRAVRVENHCPEGPVYRWDEKSVRVELGLGHTLTSNIRGMLRTSLESLAFRLDFFLENGT